MKTIQVRYTLTVDRTVEIRDELPPRPYTPKEWEQQQVLDVGDQLADAANATDWYYEILQLPEGYHIR